MTKAKPEPVSGRCRLIAVINDQFYWLRSLTPDPRVADPAWRLTKEDAAGTFYDVHVDEHGAKCTCPDFVVRRENKDSKGCKHVAALRQMGLLWRRVFRGGPQGNEVVF